MTELFLAVETDLLVVVGEGPSLGQRALLTNCVQKVFFMEQMCPEGPGKCQVPH